MDLDAKLKLKRALRRLIMEWKSTNKTTARAVTPHAQLPKLIA